MAGFIRIGFVFMFILLSISCYSQSDFNLSGKVSSSALNGKKVFINAFQHSSRYYLLFRDSAIIKNGRFKFSGKMQNAAESCAVTIEGSNQREEIILSDGATDLFIETEAAEKFTIKYDTEPNNLFNEMELLEKNHNQSLVEKKIPQSERDSLKLLMRDSEMKLISQNPDNFYSLIKVRYLFKRAFATYSIEEYYRVFQALDNKLKNSLMGKQVQGDFDYAFSLGAGSLLPDFRFRTVSNSVFTRDSLSKKLHLIAFSATWCGPCIKAIPNLLELEKKYGKNGFDVVYINMDDDKVKWKELIEKQKISDWVNLCDTTKSPKSDMVLKFNIAYFPTYFLVDETARIIYNSYLFYDLEHSELEDYIKSFLAKSKR